MRATLPAILLGDADHLVAAAQRQDLGETGVEPHAFEHDIERDQVALRASPLLKSRHDKNENRLRINDHYARNSGNISNYHGTAFPQQQDKLVLQNTFRAVSAE